MITIIILKKLRDKISNLKDYLHSLKEDFYSGDLKNLTGVWQFIIKIQIFAIYFVIAYIGGVFIILNQKVLGAIIFGSAVIYFVASFCSEKVVDFNCNIGFKILQYLLRYGKVVSPKDWKNLRKKHRKLYKALRTKRSCGYCYLFSCALAICIKDAEVLYCTIQIDGQPSGHSVVLKNNCIYDTNQKKHYSYEFFLEDSGAEVYKIFTKDEYAKRSFFDDIRPGFVEWCKERNAYCDPQ